MAKTAKKAVKAKAKAKTAKPAKTSAPKAKTSAPTAKTSAPKASAPKAKSTAPAKPAPDTKASGKKAKKKDPEIQLNVTMWEPCLPLDRGDRYEDPLFEALENAGLGGAGDGGGTLTGATGEIEQIDFDVAVHSLDAIPFVTKHLEEAGAPKGSVLRYDDNGKSKVVEFGLLQGIAIYLDGVTQPAEISASTSAQERVARLMAALPGAELRGSWQGPEETALYIYGENADKMWPTVEKVLRNYPLSKNARVVLRHGNPSNKPREVKLAK